MDILFSSSQSSDLILGEQRNCTLLFVASVLIYQNKLARVPLTDCVAFMPQQTGIPVGQYKGLKSEKSKRQRHIAHFEWEKVWQLRTRSLATSYRKRRGSGPSSLC